MSNTVVIADDDQDIRELVAIAVSRAGLTAVSIAKDGREALDAIRTHGPDLAILDVSMPELSGLEVCRAVRADDSIGDVRILLLSARVEETSVEAGIEAGADYFLEKPFVLRELVAWLAIGKEVR